MKRSDKQQKVIDIAKKIISEQYDYNKKFGIKNHFLEYVINEMVLQLAPTIKGFADFVFEYSLKNNKMFFEMKHSIECTILVNNEKLRVMMIYDESMYGPNLNYILVIDNIEHGQFYIRKLLKGTKKELDAYRKINFQLGKVNFVEDLFILSYTYMSDFMRSLYCSVENVADKDEFLKELESLREIEKMGDRSLQLWDVVEYATSMIAHVKNDIEEYEK